MTFIQGQARANAARLFHGVMSPEHIEAWDEMFQKLQARRRLIHDLSAQRRALAEGSTMEEERVSDYTVEVSRETMLGDLMSVVIDELRAAPDAWDRLPEHKQQEVIARVEQRVAAVIGDCVQLIATDNRPSIPATLKEVTFKEGIKAVLSISKGSETCHALADAQGMAVLIVIPSVGQYSGGTRPKATPNQAALPLDETNDTPEQRAEREAMQAIGAALEEAAQAGGEEQATDGVILPDYPQSDAAAQAEVDEASQIHAGEGKRRAFVITPWNGGTAFGVWGVDADDAWRVFSGKTRDAGERTAYSISPGKKRDLDVVGCVNPMDSPARQERASNEPAAA